MTPAFDRQVMYTLVATIGFIAVLPITIVRILRAILAVEVGEER